MGQSFITILVVLATNLAWGSLHSDRLFCDEPDQVSSPFLRIGLSKFGFENQVQKILKSQIPNIQESVIDINLQNKAIGGTRGTCPKYRDKPGMDAEFLCLYLPKILMGESIAVRSFSDEIKQSVGLRMNFDNVQIPEFELNNPKLNCDFKQGSAICKINVEMPRMLIQSQFDLVDPRENKKVFSTSSPLRLEINSTDKQAPQISFLARLESNGKANQAVTIIKDSMEFILPPGSVSSEIQNNEDDAINRAIEILGENIDPNLKKNERNLAMLELINSERGDEIIRSLSISYGLISIVKDFIGEADILANLQEPILNHVGEPLSILLSDIIENILPFEKSVEFSIPVPPTQDQMDGARYIERFQEIEDYLEQVRNKFEAYETYTQAKALRRSHAIEIKNIIKFIERLQTTQLKEISDELELLAFDLTTHIQVIDSKGLMSNSLRKRLLKAERSARNTAEIVKESSLPIYRKSLLHIDRVGKVDPNGLEILVSGCHLGGQSPNAPVNWHNSIPNKSKIGNNDFSFEIPVSIVNQHLELLHRNGFYNYCTAKKGKSCAERRGGGKTSFIIKKPPRIKKYKGEYIFEMPEVQRTSYTVLPNFIDKAFLRDSTRIRVCMSNLILDSATNRVIPKGCISADANIEKNFRMEHALSFLNLWSAVAVFGIKLTHTAAQEAVLDQMEDHQLARSVDNLLLKNGEYIIQELRVEDGRLSIFGKVDTKSELQ